MLKISTLTNRARFIGAAVVLTGVSAFASLQPVLVGAEQVTNRSLSLSSSAPGNVTTGPAGSATNGSAATYTFTFNAPTAGDIQSMSVMFCDTAFGYLDGLGEPRALTNPCARTNSTTAMSFNSASVSVDVNGETWTRTNGSQPNVLLLAGAAPITLAANDLVTVIVEGVTNPTPPSAASYANGGNTFFGHIDTYSDSARTTPVDDGTVASAITPSIGITARVQETLRFSVGVNDTDIAGDTSACPALDPGTNGNTITLGDAVNGALDATVPYYAESFFRLNTNAANGASVNYSGRTLTSGSNSITAIGGTGSVSSYGNEQFGLGIDNTTNVLSQLAPVGDYGQADTTNNMFAFVDTFEAGPQQYTPQELATATTPVICDTAQVRYVGNIENNTEAGIYRTSVNYIAVPRY